MLNYLLQADDSFIVQFLRRPCNRTAFMHGISGGIVSGLLYFVFTSRMLLFIQFYTSIVSFRLFH